ncbi:Pnap_2097 family protein [Inquilinus ginsengisoli]|nr:Pnap_2097 family protein [Inquilinus ginsengisoli]
MMNWPFTVSDLGDSCRLGVHAPAEPAAPPSRSDRILLGMPHLSGNGLSEIWLLKELGHRHWLLLAESAGRPAPDFRDEAGQPVYAAFCALSIEDANFAAARANDRLRITSSLARLSRTQMSSRHHLAIEDRPIGVVTMISTFVRRAPDGGNHTVARVAIEGLPPVGEGTSASKLAGLAAGFRAGRVERHMGFDLHRESELGTWTFNPCPSLDFNGAGFLYFASFVVMVDRAEWRFEPVLARAVATVRRDVFFYGNVDRCETVTACLLARREPTGALIHHCRLRRGSDGAVIGDVFTTRTVADRVTTETVGGV